MIDEEVIGKRYYYYYSDFFHIITTNLAYFCVLKPTPLSILLYLIGDLFPGVLYYLFQSQYSA